MILLRSSGAIKQTPWLSVLLISLILVSISTGRSSLAAAALSSLAFKVAQSAGVWATVDASVFAACSVAQPAKPITVVINTDSDVIGEKKIPHNGLSGEADV